MHRRSLDIGFPIKVFIGNRVHRRVPRHAQPHAILDTDEPGEHALTLIGIRVLNHHCGLEIVTIRDQGVVRVKLILYTGFLEYFFHAQHLLHLITHGEFIFKNQCHVYAKRHCAIFLVRDHACAKLRPRLGIGLQRHQAILGDLGHGVSQSVSRKKRVWSRRDSYALPRTPHYTSAGV